MDDKEYIRGFEDGKREKQENIINALKDAIQNGSIIIENDYEKLFEIINN